MLRQREARLYLGNGDNACRNTYTQDMHYRRIVKRKTQGRRKYKRKTLRSQEEP